MHARTPGPKQTIPARLKAGCDNQIEDYLLLWGVRWTSPRRPSRSKKDRVHLNQPNTSDAPHNLSFSESSSSATSKPTYNAPYTIPPATADGGGSMTATSLTGHQRNFPSLSSDIVPTAVGPHQMHPSSSFPELDVARSVKLHPPASVYRHNVPSPSRHPSAEFEGPSSPTPLCAAPQIAVSARDSLVADDHAVSPWSPVDDSTEYRVGGARVIDYRCDDVDPSFSTYPLQYQLSSHSELAAFAWDSEPIAPTQQPIVTRERQYSPSRW